MRDHATFDSLTVVKGIPVVTGSRGGRLGIVCAPKSRGLERNNGRHRATTGGLYGTRSLVQDKLLVILALHRRSTQHFEMSEHRPVRFPAFLRIRAPEKLPAAVSVAAERKLTTPSEYARQAIIERLKADGFSEELSAA
jgi:hypothetical protein